jgi:hypothetical protein
MLSGRPVLNENITKWLSGLLGSIGTGDTPTLVTAAVLIALFAMTLGIFIWYFKKQKLLETPYNIQQVVKRERVKADAYVKQSVNRKDLPNYLREVQKQGVPASHMALTNFYVSTVNGAGLFYPAEDGVISPVAAQLAVTAGVRGFVFDIWPDLTPGSNFGPILQVVEQGTLWRRVTLNAMSFATILNTIVNEVFLRTPNDILYIYLRFRGSPRYSTYEGTMNALRGNLEQYRLDASFNACRGQERLFKTPITQLFGKAIVLSNMKARETPLADYINAAPMEGIRIDWTPRDISALTDTMRGEQKVKIQQNLSVVALPLEDPASENNAWDWKEGHALGVHMAAMNIWKKSANLDAYMAPNMFGTFSYKIKPEPLRFILDIIPPPGQPQDPGWGEGDDAGKLGYVEPIREN